MLGLFLLYFVSRFYKMLYYNISVILQRRLFFVIQLTLAAVRQHPFVKFYQQLRRKVTNIND